MPRSRQAAAVSSQTVPLSLDLVRAVSNNPSLREDTVSCLQGVAGEARTNEISKTAILQSGAINQLVLELEAGLESQSRSEEINIQY